jgi:hypothetical protein
MSNHFWTLNDLARGQIELVRFFFGTLLAEHTGRATFFSGGGNFSGMFLPPQGSIDPRNFLKNTRIILYYIEYDNYTYTYKYTYDTELILLLKITTIVS